ncbi:SDR family NAD(P)-dependent oxidoreductase [Zunongwangia profunda]|uniref:Short-chain dehydrogenase/reductase family protein n=2 Tax=Zunongwangia profunda TaxID=398743 RepID=D5BM87_ZUNPS|nr:SDR family oxidoreductase [Zunongwangia profunda]MAC64901.1 NAD(P)-dependent oxidoreductase [Flavobacteriaceae bacterium]MAS72216.1 NAD(P)-dependent oxidoreductase [Zunongwangia sp.]ADF54227.1 short-chain dehydrogenase/reductase family protein [Zunongwangia profunda SM-A87]HAJ81301.1 SDR family NAD(P)-dependent oxidoreductase [Zunongwangia profunda]HCV82852.1 SDR family NAD(P)-dependent oxidoreductase [Zunongwangia profunda]|tara:strand:+ start:9157 stop:9840 length:684 start_codon:yes stop_codon:yes gene_type:complete
MKNVVITGTSRGIGFELVKLFAEEDFNVLALSRNKEPVAKLKLDNVNSFSCDLGNESDLKKASDFVQKEWGGKVDILIHNAGAFLNKPFQKTTLEEFRAIYEINVFGLIGLTQQLLPFMTAKSHILSISSMGGVQGSLKFAGLSAYSSSKAAIITLTELLAEEYKENGPVFNVLALGAVQTEMLAAAFPGLEAPLSAREMATYIKDFSITGSKFYNGKLLQVSNSTP